MKTEEVTKEEFIEIVFNTALAKSILANQFALHCNEVLKHSKYYKGNVKKWGTPYINALIKAEREEFEKVDGVDTDRVDEVLKSTDNLLKVISKCVLMDFQQLESVILEFKKRPDEVLKLLNIQPHKQDSPEI